ncbi:MAG: carboxymuconolactone decarboxylase family protein [Burkholderiaceae bacterium]
MPRLPYVTDEQAGTTPLVTAIRQRRGGGLLNLDRQLLHSPPFAHGWNALLGAVRTGLAVDPKLRELAMCVVAVLNTAEYEFIHHAPVFLEAGGTRAQIDAIRQMASAPIDHGSFDELENATIALSMQMTRVIAVEESTFATLRRHLGDAQVVELVGVIAAYNMVSRFLIALGVEPE